MEASFVEVVRQAIAKHLPSQKESAGANYAFDDKEAFEGYEQDRVVTTRARNRLLVEQCRKRDNNTCRACGFCLLVDNGQYVIECHHVNPLSKSGFGWLLLTNSYACVLRAIASRTRGATHFPSPSSKSS